MIGSRVALTAVVLAALGGFGSAALASPSAPAGRPQSLASARVVSLEERVAAQRAVEQVYWRHREWPATNPGSKPSLDEVMPAALIRAKVLDGLRKSAALASYWGRPVTHEDLQREMDRMTAGSRAPEMLQEIFDALHQDPVLIAETLARPNLVDREIRAAFAQDDRIHGALRRQAQAAARGLRVRTGSDLLDAMRSAGRYSEVAWRRGELGGTAGSPSAIALDAEEWADLERRLTAEAGGAADRARVLIAGELQEQDDAFFVRTVKERGADTIQTATVAWPKTPFETWWNQAASGFTPDLGAVSGPFVIAAPLASNACTADTWTPTALAALSPTARWGQTAIWTGTQMIVWGGMDGFGLPLSSGSRYTPATDAWSAVSADGVPSARSRHTAVWSGTEMVVWGGMGVAGGALSTGGRYNPVSDTWRPVSNDPQTGALSARFGHTASWAGTQMIVWGGTDGTNYLGDGARYSPSFDTWGPVGSTNAPSPRADHTAVWTGSELVVWGGFDGSSYLGTGSSYKPQTDGWTAMPTFGAPSGRVGHTAVLLITGISPLQRFRVAIWGGYDGTAALGDGAIFDPLDPAVPWIPLAGANAPSPRTQHTAVAAFGRMIVWGGADTAGNDLADGAVYEPFSNSWSATPATNAPSARALHTAVWSGSEMIVWGGKPGAGTAGLDTGARFNLTLNEWTGATRRTERPGRRTLHTAVYTGSEMIVWGGRSVAGTLLATGDRYDPATDAWRSVSLAGAPSARVYHTAVWSGTEMIVWGGEDLAGATNAGARYNATTDTWTATPAPPSGVPEPRARHSAVWAGTQMIVWGGDDAAGNAFQTGGRFTPASSGWVETPLTNAPSARSGHTAVWTGTKMIVWGGADGAGPLGSGAEFDPNVAPASAWLPIIALGPPARSGHTAVWSGTEMIVWGGTDSTGAPLANGGRYVPAQLNWRTISASGAPSARSGHAAGWNGKEMVVWGGKDAAGAPLATGARYGPQLDTWNALSAEGAPSARYGHSVVFTNAEMVFFGGEGANGEPRDDGGRYCACVQVRTFYRDADADTFGDPAVTLATCDSTPPAGYVADSRDCNDQKNTVNPNRPEVCDGIDNNCNGRVDEGFDNDADGVGFCVDNSPTIFNPDQQDYDGDGIGNLADTGAAAADIDHSGIVDGYDLGRFALVFGLKDGEVGFDRAADFDIDGDVDGADLATLAAAFGSSVYPDAAQFLRAPGNFQAVFNGTSAANLTWTQSANATGYRIDRVAVDLANPPAVPDRKWVALTFLSGGALSYQDTGLSPNFRYRYRVVAYSNTAIASAASRVDFFRIPGAGIVAGAWAPADGTAVETPRALETSGTD